MPTRSKKTGFVNPNYKYHEIVKVSTKVKFKKKHGAMEVNLKKCLEIFFEVKKEKLRYYTLVLMEKENSSKKLINKRQSS